MQEAVLEAAKEAVHAMESNNNNEDGDSGTTACVVVLTPDWIVCSNAGDSRSVFSKAGNRAVPLSYDHKPDDEEEERRIRAAGGYVAGGRVEGDLAVSRGLGDFRFKSMDTVCAGAHSTATTNVKTVNDQGTATTTRVTMAPGEQKVSSVPDIIVQNRNAEQDEFIIVACDGIWDVQSNPECVAEVAALFQEGESDLGLICEETLDVCLRLGSKDNMTTLIVKFKAQQIGKGGGVLARRKKRDTPVNVNVNEEDDAEQPQMQQASS
jgi:serine/threonine protein phosphatase PrpC